MPDILEGFPTTSRNPGWTPNYSRTSERAFQTFRRVSRPFPDIREGLPDIWKAFHHTRAFGRVSRPLPNNRESLRPLLDFRECLLTTTVHSG